MENFFGGLIADKSGKLAGSGQNPTTVGSMGNSIARVKAKMKLPTEISAQQVIDLEREMGQVDAELQLADDIISTQEKLLGKAVDLYAKNTRWAAGLIHDVCAWHKRSPGATAENVGLHWLDVCINRFVRF